MAWLVSAGRVLASAQVADGFSQRARGLIGRQGIDGALLIERCRSVHTIGMRFAIDVAYLDAAGTVLKIEHLRPYRVGMPVRRAVSVVEAEAGAFERWALRTGDVVELRP